MMGDIFRRDRASNNIMDCVMDMTEEEEEEVVHMDLEVIDNESEEKSTSDKASRVGEGSPYPVLTVEKVLETFKRISAIKTPDINSKLAIPFKKEPVGSSSKFKEEYLVVKNDIRKVSGGQGKEAYHAEKERRKSAPFSWPNPSPSRQGGRIGCNFLFLYVGVGGAGVKLQSHHQVLSAKTINEKCTASYCFL